MLSEHSITKLVLICKLFDHFYGVFNRGGTRTAATSKMEHFVIIVNDWKPLTIITKRFILDVAAVLDPPLQLNGHFCEHFSIVSAMKQQIRVDALDKLNRHNPFVIYLLKFNHINTRKRCEICSK